MSMKKNLLAGICVNLLIFGVFLLMIHQLDVFMQLIFSFAPILISIIVAIIMNRNHNSKRSDNLQCAMICAAFNCIYLIAEYICISTVKDINDIYEVSQKYNSGYVTISENHSPVLSIIIFTITSFILHYFVIKWIGAGKNKS